MATSPAPRRIAELVEPVTAVAFAPVARAFYRMVGRGRAGGALVVRLRGETVLDLRTGWADRLGRRPWTPQTLALSFSTTKGVVSTVIHRLVDRGLVGYDEPVAAYWPEFAVGGKDRVTVRHLLSHRAGLQSARAVADRAEDLLDHVGMEERLAARAVPAPTRRSAYHAITYGWLVAGLARRITGRGMSELVADEIVDPLALRGMHIGVPEDARESVAEPVGSTLKHLGSTANVLAPLWTRNRKTTAALDALHVPGFHRLFEGPEPPIWTTEMPAVNGALGAEALARMYGALANDGVDAGRRLLSSETARDLGRVQVRSRDAVLGLPMRWRLGYHQAFGLGREAPKGFGHYGYGGSGGWADPTLGLSLGFVTNRIGSVSTPLGDLTLFRLSGVVRACALRFMNGH
jgi:CubicO group peptidase (beta-lactamase class C family)